MAQLSNDLGNAETLTDLTAQEHNSTHAFNPTKSSQLDKYFQIQNINKDSVVQLKSKLQNPVVRQSFTKQNPFQITKLFNQTQPANHYKHCFRSTQKAFTSQQSRRDTQPSEHASPFINTSNSWHPSRTRQKDQLMATTTKATAQKPFFGNETVKALELVQNHSRKDRRVFYNTDQVLMKRAFQVRQRLPLESSRDKLTQQAVSKSIARDPTINDFMEKLTKFKDSLAPFYTNDKIETVTEHQLMQGNTNFELSEIDYVESSIPHMSSKSDRPKFKNQMAKKMVHTLNTFRQEDFEAHGKTVEERQVKKMVFLNEQFEDDEVEVIHQLYSKHFRPQEVAISKSNSQSSQQNQKESDSTHGSARNDKGVKYVQFIPKVARGTLEDSLNQIYLNGDFQQSLFDQNSLSAQKNRRNETFSQTFTSTFQTQQCYSSHRHARTCANTKRTDIADLSTKAFKYLILQKPNQDPRTILKNEEKNYSVSFYPKSKIPSELVGQIENGLTFKARCFLPSNLLSSKINKQAKSRFNASQSTPLKPIKINSQKITVNVNELCIDLPLHDNIQPSQPSKTQKETHRSRTTELRQSQDSSQEKASSPEIAAESQSQQKTLHSEDRVQSNSDLDITTKNNQMRPVERLFDQIETHFQDLNASTIGSSKQNSTRNPKPFKNELDQSPNVPRHVVVLSKKRNSKRNTFVQKLDYKPKAEQSYAPEFNQNPELQQIFKKRSAERRENDYVQISNKKTWVSPFMHSQNCRDNLKKNLGRNICSNMNRSFNVQNNASIVCMLNRPEKLYEQEILKNEVLTQALNIKQVQQFKVDKLVEPHIQTQQTINSLLDSEPGSRDGMSPFQ